jgi:serine/threonine protein kinase
MIQVMINGKKATLTNRDVIGTGGEANIFKYKEQALKLYLQPDAERDQKLRAMLPLAAHLPPEVIAPQTLVQDAKGKNAVGFLMRLLTSDYTEARQLSSKKYRAMSGVTARDVARLFVKAGAALKNIHQAGMIVGDLNDLNLMFRADEMLYIDVDSFQFGQYPCMVGTEAFLDPALYNCNLAAQPMFTPENDWYSFAVLLFKSLLLAHPYGGVHKSVNLLTQRAMQHLSIFTPDVTYPRVAYPLELVDDDLLHVFNDLFTRGQRGEFPLEELRAYADSLQVCAACGDLYPSQRSRCPHCSALIPVAAVANAQARVLARMAGQIVAWHVAGNMARFIAHEGGKAVLYVLKGQTLLKKQPLFDAIPTATYAFLEELLIISPAPESSDVLVIDTSGAQPTAALQTTTGQYGNDERVFGAGGSALYRLANGYLMRGSFRYGQYAEQAVMAISEDQTWLRVAPDGEKVFGFFRVFNQYNHWLLVGKSQIEVELNGLSIGEFLIETSVKFGDTTALIMRLTQRNGADMIRMDEIDYEGRVLRSRIITDVDTFTPLDAHAYARNLLLYATDKGVIREKQDTGAKTTFQQTENIVKTGQRLFAYEQGLLVVGDETVMYLMS